MDQNQAIQGLHQKSLLAKILDSRAEMEENLSKCDDELVHLEAEMESKNISIQELEKSLHSIKIEMGGLVERVASRKKTCKELEQKRSMIEDFEGLLKGKLFCGSVEGAKFFTQTLKDFAHEKNVDKLMVEELVRNSQDGFSFVLQDKTCFFVKGESGGIYVGKAG